MVVEQASSFQARQAAAFGTCLARAGIPLQVHLWGSVTCPPQSLVRLIRRRPVRAVVVGPLRRRASDQELSLLLDQRPEVPRLMLGDAGPGTRVRADNAQGMRLVARHLVHCCGVGRVLVVRGLPHHADSREREIAVTAELVRLGVPATAMQVVTGGFERDRSFRVVRAALERRPDIDAVVALNDRSALGALDAAAAVGRLVPEDLVVTGFDDEDFAEFSQPALTTVSQDPEEQARLATEQLLRIFAGQRAHDVAVPVRLVVRGSTAGPVTSGAAGAERGAAPGRRGSTRLLWERVAGLDSMLAINRSFLSCGNVEGVVRTLAEGLPGLGLARGYLVLRDEPLTQEPPRGRLMMAYDMLAEETARPERLGAPEPFDLCDLLPPDLSGSLDAGTLIVHPLESDYGELGYLLLDQGGADPQVGEALRMDLGRAIETVRGTSQLRARTRQLEAEVASRRAAWEALVHQAHHDPLTGLANRTAFLIGADAAITDSGGAATLVLVDLHRFKDINDALGHDVGDAVLCEIAGRLIRLLGTGALLGRLAGDEFAVLVPGMAQPKDAVALGNRIVSELRERAAVGGVHVEIDGRVGVALAPEHAHDSGTLLRMADIALHGGGGDGRCGVALFDPAQQERVSRRLALFGELRRALSERELVVHYQPIVTLARGEVTGVEALVRWRHPERGLLLPGEFIDVAEQTGLIDPLTTYVLDRALRDCRGWREDGTALKVAVNLSAKRLSDADLPREVDHLLGRHHLPPSALILEITESAVMSDPERALAVLDRLRRLGTALSVDDFGTGQASLTYLTRLPVSGLKIDRSFVQPMESDAATRTIVRSILHLAGDLGLDVVAEGVESDAAYHSLGAFGCDQAQGFWLARPAPAARVPGLVRDLRTRLADRASNQAEVATGGPVVPRPRPPAAVPAQDAVPAPDG